jgi:SAM-dependent methyltransferase
MPPTDNQNARFVDLSHTLDRKRTRMSNRPCYSTEYVRRRFDRLAAIYPIFDWLLWLPRGICNEAVRRMRLLPDGRVLEIGCGTGWNFSAILGAVGSHWGLAA